MKFFPPNSTARLPTFRTNCPDGSHCLPPGERSKDAPQADRQQWFGTAPHPRGPSRGCSGGLIADGKARNDTGRAASGGSQEVAAQLEFHFCSPTRLLCTQHAHRRARALFIIILKPSTLLPPLWSSPLSHCRRLQPTLESQPTAASRARCHSLTRARTQRRVARSQLSLRAAMIAALRAS